MNRTIIASSAVILSIGVIRAVINNQPLTRVVQGSLVVVTLLSLFDTLDPAHLGKLASSLAALSAVTVVMVELPEILKAMHFI